MLSADANQEFAPAVHTTLKNFLGQLTCHAIAAQAPLKPGFQPRQVLAIAVDKLEVQCIAVENGTEFTLHVEAEDVNLKLV